MMKLRLRSVLKSNPFPHIVPNHGVGPNRLIRRIADGPMPTVYLAERQDGHFRRRVALKVHNGEPANEEMKLRFRSERQILAQFNHPCIAQLLDGGETPQGHPYVVMEHIAGSSLIDYVESHNLSVEARLQLFLKVCSAVEYSHQRLIVHRDIKPDNILVDAQGAPKLLDFGIAKLLRPDFVQMTVARTQIGERLLTPLYASPEQVQGQTRPSPPLPICILWACCYSRSSLAESRMKSRGADCNWWRPVAGMSPCERLNRLKRPR